LRCESCKNKDFLIKKLENDIKNLYNSKTFQYKQISVISNKINSEKSKFEKILSEKDTEYTQIIEKMKDEYDIATQNIQDLIKRIENLTNENQKLLQNQNLLVKAKTTEILKNNKNDFICKTQTSSIEQLLQIKNGLEAEIRRKDLIIERLILQNKNNGNSLLNSKNNNQNYRIPLKPIINSQENISQHNPKIMINSPKNQKTPSSFFENVKNKNSNFLTSRGTSISRMLKSTFG